MDCIELSIAFFTVAESKLRLTMDMTLPKRGALPKQSRTPPAALTSNWHVGDNAACIHFQGLHPATKVQGLKRGSLPQAGLYIKEWKNSSRALYRSSVRCRNYAG